MSETAESPPSTAAPNDGALMLLEGADGTLHVADKGGQVLGTLPRSEIRRLLAEGLSRAFVEAYGFLVYQESRAPTQDELRSMSAMLSTTHIDHLVAAGNLISRKATAIGYAALERVRAVLQAQQLVAPLNQLPGGPTPPPSPPPVGKGDGPAPPQESSPGASGPAADGRSGTAGGSSDAAALPRIPGLTRAGAERLGGKR